MSVKWKKHAKQITIRIRRNRERKNCNDGLPACREGLCGDGVRAFFIANNWRREMTFPRSQFRSHYLIGVILLRTRSKICGPYPPFISFFYFIFVKFHKSIFLEFFFSFYQFVTINVCKGLGYIEGIWHKLVNFFCMVRIFFTLHQLQPPMGGIPRFWPYTSGASPPIL